MKKNSFDILRDWGNLSDDELAKVFSKGAARTLSALMQDLGTEKHNTQAITSDNFSKLVREMRELMRTGSRRLGEAIIKASDYRDHGRVQDAILVYRDFLASCPSHFYKAIAEKELDQLLSGKGPATARARVLTDVKQLKGHLTRVRNILHKCAGQLAGLESHSRENLRRIGEADRNICEIEADIESVDEDKDGGRR